VAYSSSYYFSDYSSGYSVTDYSSGYRFTDIVTDYEFGDITGALIDTYLALIFDTYGVQIYET
jgi:hypothetical protein